MLILLASLSALADEPAADASKEGADEEQWNVNDAHGPTHDVHIETTEGTWMSVSVHGGTILFDLLGDIWSIPLAGGVATRITEGAAWDSEPRFSPDGSRIAYVSDEGGNEQIWLMNADGSDKHQFTQEDEARVTDPVWDPAGAWLIVRRRTVDTRSIGVTELWQVHLDGGKGFQLTDLDGHPHAGESTTDGRYIWYSDRAGRFDYNQNPVGGLWHIERLDRQTGDSRPVAFGAGSAARPLLSPDGKSLVFISRDRTQTLLESLDMASGQRRVVADWLDHDQMEGFALHGVYPAMDWTDDGRLVLWAGGKLWSLDVASGERAEIPFQIDAKWTLHDVPRWPQPVEDSVQAKVIRWPVRWKDGFTAFSALGVLWVWEPDGNIRRLSEGTGYAPAWGPQGQLAWTSYDAEGGRLHITSAKGKTETLPLQGLINNPAWSDDGQRLVALRGPGGSTSPDLNSEPFLEIVLLEKEGRKGWTQRVVTTIADRGSRSPRLFLHDDRIWFMEDRPTEPRKPTETVFVSVDLQGADKRTHLVLGGAQEVVPSPDWTRVAYKVDHNVHVTALPQWAKEVSVEALPSVQLTEVVGDWLSWSADGTSVTWAEGNELKTLAVPTLAKAEGEDGEEADKPEPQVQTIALTLPRAEPTGALALTHARLITMKGDEVLEDATVVIEGSRITSINGDIPEGAEVIDLTGKTVIPGLVDVHAHLHYTAGDVLPPDEWRYQVNLDFGVTTVHDPSASTDLVFTQAERVAAGFMEGPRVYSTGFVLYGALANDGAKTPDVQAARNHVQRLKDVGAISVKVYQQSQRTQRQWYVAACDELQIQCVAEGGGDLWLDLSMVADGMHAIEHAFPNAPLYGDVVQFVAGSHTDTTLGTAYSPTLLVAYGGLSGEHYFYQHDDVLDDERLARHYPRRSLDARAWRLPIMAHDDDWNHQQVARDAAVLASKGTLVTLGAHGQLQGLGPHWELWGLGGPGAMSPHDALRAATIQGARYVGMEAEIGSIEPGKLADLVVLDADPLQDIHNSHEIHLVIANGVVRE